MKVKILEELLDQYYVSYSPDELYQLHKLINEFEDAGYRVYDVEDTLEIVADVMGWSISEIIENAYEIFCKTINGWYWTEIAQVLWDDLGDEDILEKVFKKFKAEKLRVFPYLDSMFRFLKDHRGILDSVDFDWYYLNSGVLLMW